MCSSDLHRNQPPRPRMKHCTTRRQSTGMKALTIRSNTFRSGPFDKEYPELTFAGQDDQCVLMASGTTRPSAALGRAMPRMVETVGAMSVIEVRRMTSPFTTCLPKKTTGTWVS